MKKKKHTPKVNLYKILTEAVETGATFGVNRAFKYSDNPTTESIIDQVTDEVMLALEDVIDFKD